MSGVALYCEDCGRSSGYQHSEADARRAGWLLRKNGDRYVIRCPTCREGASDGR